MSMSLTRMTDQGGRDTISYLRQNLVLKDRFLFFRRFKQCFTGSEAVDAIIKFHGCSRERAVKLGSNLLAQRLILHVNNKYVLATIQCLLDAYFAFL